MNIQEILQVGQLIADILKTLEGMGLKFDPGTSVNGAELLKLFQRS